MARQLNELVLMRITAVAVALLLLSACRGEPTPRDYQNNPPAMTHPPTTSSQTPTAHGLPGPSPEPSKGVEGSTPPPKTSTLPDQAPSNATTPTTATTTVTTTHT